jgi:SAM-dependent methyltransferase
MKIENETMYFTGERIIPEVKNYFFYEHLARYRLAKTYMRSGYRLLDAGCGDGYGAFYLSSFVNKVMAIDVSDETITLAGMKYRAANLEFKAVDPEHWPFSEEFDVVTCFEVFEHVDKPESLLREINRSLKKDGLLIISTPNRNVFGEKLKIPFHVREYSLQEFIDILRAYFSVKEIFGQLNRGPLLVKKWNFWISQQAMNYPFILSFFNWYISKKPKKYLSPGYFDRLELKDNYFSKDNVENSDYFIAVCKKIG